MNIQRRTARVSTRLLRCLILWEYDRSRHANIAHGGTCHIPLLLSWQRSDEHDLDVVAFRIVHESGVIGRSVVRAQAGLSTDFVRILVILGTFVVFFAERVSQIARHRILDHVIGPHAFVIISSESECAGNQQHAVQWFPLPHVLVVLGLCNGVQRHVAFEQTVDGETGGEHDRHPRERR